MNVNEMYRWLQYFKRRLPADHEFWGKDSMSVAKVISAFPLGMAVTDAVKMITSENWVLIDSDLPDVPESVQQLMAELQKQDITFSYRQYSPNTFTLDVPNPTDLRYTQFEDRYRLIITQSPDAQRGNYRRWHIVIRNQPENG